MSNKSKLRLGLLGLLIFINWIVWLAVSEAAPLGLRVDFLDVGQGDAILIRTPDRHNILVDGGPDGQVLTELGKVLPLWERRIDLVVATHLDADHITGLVSVLKRYQVTEVLTPLPSKSTKISEAWQQVILVGTTVNYVDAADDYMWGDVSWDTLLPLSSNDTLNNDTNNASIVSKLTYRGIDMLLTGDMEAPEESLLMQLYPATSIDILKVAHHGSRFSSNDAFLDILDPEAAIISVGQNSYGHPTPEVLERLEVTGADIYRTDQDGTIEVIFGDNGYSVKTNGQKEFYPN